MKKVIGFLMVVLTVISCNSEDMLVPTPTEVTEKLQIVGLTTVVFHQLLAGTFLSNITYTGKWSLYP